MYAGIDNIDKSDKAYVIIYYLNNNSIHKKYC